MKSITRHIVDKDTRHFVQIYNDFIESDAFRRLSPAAFKVYTVLKFRAMGKENCIPSKKRISDDSGMTERVVTMAVNELIASGLIIKHERKRADGSQSSNEYTIVKTQGGVQIPYPPPGIDPYPHEQDKSEQELRSTTVLREEDDEREDREDFDPPRDFGGVPDMRPIDVHGWWHDHHNLPYPKRPDGREMRAAKQLLDKGFDTEAKLIELYEWIRSDDFWKTKGITLVVMDSRATAYRSVQGSFAKESKQDEMLSMNMIRLARLKRREFVGTYEFAKYMQFEGEKHLADDIAMLERMIANEDGTTSPA